MLQHFEECLRASVFFYRKVKTSQDYFEVGNILKSKWNPQIFPAYKNLTTFYFIVCYWNSQNPSGEMLLNSCFMVI